MDTSKNAGDGAEAQADGSASFAEETVGEAVRELQRMVRQHPLEAVLVTLGVGVAVGVLLGRRS